MQGINIELLAPAGNTEAFYGAIHAGADAVYLGGNRFGARAYAENFTEQELISCIRYAHIFGRKVYLTVNTLIKESEFKDLYLYLKPFYEAGLDAVIVQDIGVFHYIKKQFPEMELHVSTQMTITGEYGAVLLKEWGASRVVPARELNLEEIKILKNKTGLEVETFIHGAMCYCYSGQCLFSSVLGGRSGNRGKCAQPCRLPYSVSSGSKATPEMYPLSLKDMCTIEYIPELLEAGISSFKIEGRMKKPEYSAGVTAIYRKYVDMYLNSANKEFKVSAKDLKTLSGLYIRSQRQDGYYHKHNGKDMVTLNSPAYSATDESLLSEIRTRYLDKILKQKVTVYGYFKVGEPAVVTYLTGDVSISVSGETVQQAAKQPITSDNVLKQLSKLGDTAFEINETFITVDDNAFYSLKSLNELRREAVTQLENSLIQSHGLVPSRTALPEIQSDSSSLRPTARECGMHISVRTLQQLEMVLEQRNSDFVKRIYIDGDLLYNEAEAVSKMITAGYQTEYVIELPRILRARDERYTGQLMKLTAGFNSRASENASCNIISGFCVGSIEALGYLLSKNFSGKIYTSPCFYIWNHVTLCSLKNIVSGICMPYELNSGEQKALLSSAEMAGWAVACEKVFYGRIPMMVTANCVAQTMDSCHKNSGRHSIVLLKDRYSKNFPVVLNCTHCMNTIYNSVPLSLHNEWKKWDKYTDMRIDFTIENERETEKILTYFTKVFRGLNTQKDIELPFDDYTTGHEKRGTE